MRQEAAALESLTREELYREIEDLQARLQDEQEYSRAIRNGEVDALVVSDASGEQIFTLKEADRPYRVIIEEMQEGTVTLSDDGIILYSNRQFARMLDTPLSRLMGSSFYECVDPSCRSTIEDLLSRRSGQTKRAEVAFVTSKGGKVYTYVSFSPLEVDQAYTFCGVITDITPERIAREGLKKSNALLERIFDNTHIMAAFMGRDFRFIRVNHAFASACGVAPERLVGRSFIDLCPGREEIAVFRSAMENGEPYNAMEKPFRPFRAREARYCDWNLQPVKDEEGRTEGMILTLIDRTDRKKLERERLRFEKAVEQAGDGIVITDEKGTIRYLNSASETISGYSRDELLGERLSLFNGESRDDIIRAIGLDGLWKGRVSAPRKDFSRMDVDATVSPVHDDEGRVLNYVVIEHDVTNETQLEQQMRQVQKMEALGRLAGGIAHDLNNILYPIIINAEMTLEDMDAGSQLHTPLQQILTAAYRQRDLVKQILAFSRRSEQKFKPVSVTPLVQEALRFIRASLPSTIEIKQNIRAGADTVLGDSTQLHQVIMNICSNAADAIVSRTGTIEVTLDNVFYSEPPARLKIQPGTYLRLVITDTGQGMSREVIDRIFEPFFTTKEVGKGSGMGLSVVHGILESHGGVIMVNSEIGRGSTFTVLLPLYEKASERQVSSIVSIGPSACRKKILLVDDEEFVLSSVGRALGRLGYDVATAGNAREAIRMIRSSPGEFDLIITDQAMPHMTGEQLVEEIMHMRPGMPVILCTGFGEAVSEQEARNKGIREVIMKPATSEDLSRAVRRVLGA